jgi:hypothetical protein
MFQGKQTSGYCVPSSSVAIGDYDEIYARLPERTIGASISPSLKSELGRVQVRISTLCRFAGGGGDEDEDNVRMVMARQIPRM